MRMPLRLRSCNARSQCCRAKEDQVKEHLQQLDFETAQEKVRVVRVHDASAPIAPTDNKQFKYLVAAPVALLFMVLGLFFLLEVKEERVADPDSLSTRVRSEVYALPPLPIAPIDSQVGCTTGRHRSSNSSSGLISFDSRFVEVRPTSAKVAAC